MAIAPQTFSQIQRRLSGGNVQLSGRTLFNADDYNPDLQGQLGTAKYERMRRDPEIAGALMRWKKPLEAANWSLIEPEEGDPKAIKTMMELADRYVLKPLKRGLLQQILLKYDFGVSAIEKVWALNEKGQQVFYRLAPIPPQTIREFELGDQGELVRMVQYAFTSRGFKRQEIPEKESGAEFEDKAAVFVYRMEGDNYFGRPPLRELFQPWFHKSELWVLDGMQKERCGMGITVIKIPTSITDTSSDEYKAAEKLAFEMRAHERQGAVIGVDWELDQIFPTGTQPDILGSQRYCDEQIQRGMGTDFTSLGSQGASGSRALGESKNDHFMLCRQADADEIEEEINRQLIEVLCRMNVGPQPEYPMIKCEDLDKMTGTQQSEVLKNLGTFIRYDRKLEEHLRENNDLPEIDDATREEPPDPLELIGAKGNGNGNGAVPVSNGNRVPNGNAEKVYIAGGDATNAPVLPGPKPDTQNRSEPPAEDLWKIDARPLYREPFPHEAHVNFEKMSGFLDIEPRRIWHRVIAPFREAQIRKIALAASKATDKDLSNGLPGIAPFRGSMAAALGDALLAVYRKGRLAVVGERDLQLGLTPPEYAMKAYGDEDEDDVVEPTQAQRGWIKTIATGMATGLIASLVERAKDVALLSRQTDATAARQRSEVERELRALSEDRPIANLSGLVARSFATGREEQAKAMRPDVEAAFYSAIMDENTCEACASRDGERHDLDDENYATPSPFCDWPANCRCVSVYVFRQEAA